MVVGGTLNILAKSALVRVLASWRNTVMWSVLESYVVTRVLMMEVMIACKLWPVEKKISAARVQANAYHKVISFA